MIPIIKEQDKKITKCGIIFCATTIEVDLVTDYLNTQKINAIRYHSKLSQQTKINNFQLWYEDKINIIVATGALSMGIDKLNIRWIIHSSLSMNLIDFYQKSGRAGRDNKPATIVMCFALSDRLKINNILSSNYNKNNIMDSAAQLQYSIKLREMWKMIHWCCNKVICRKSLLYSYFDESFSSPKCYNNKIKEFGCDIPKKYHSLENVKNINVDDIVYNLQAMLFKWDQKKRNVNRSFNTIVAILKGSEKKNFTISR